MEKLEWPAGRAAMIVSPICSYCERLIDSYERTCEAFDEIPDEIFQGDNDHTEPFEGDDGLRFVRFDAEGRKAIKAVDPREEAELRLQRALEALFAKLASDIAGRIAKGEPVPDELLTVAFGSVIEPQLIEAATAEGIRIAAEVGVQFDPAVVNEAAVQWARTYNYDLVKGLTETSQKTLQNAIAKYHETPGMTRGELEKLLEPAFGKARAESIAVTETTRAYSQGMSQYQAQLDGMGITMSRRWLTNNDELACPICRPLNGKPESEWKGAHPDGPPAHVRCRCSTVLKSVKE